MAVYGRHKEKWDPTKPKAKTTKNRTYELKKTNSLGGQFLPSDVLYEFIRTNSIFNSAGTDYVTGGYTINSNATALESGDNLLIGREYVTFDIIEATRYKDKSLKFWKVEDGNGGFHRSYIRPSPNSLFTGQVFNGPRAFTTYISFWLRLDSQDFEGSDGHSFGGLYRTGDSNDDTAIEDQDPILLFSVSTTGQLIIRYLDPIDGNVDPQQDGTYTPDHITWSVPITDKMITPNEWVYCTVGFTPITSISSDLSGSVKLWINGNPVSLGIDAFGQISGSTDGLEWRLGNTGNTFDDRIGENLYLSDGFEGSLGEISLITQSHTTVEEWNNFAKFLYEAYKDGVYALHSGIHSSGVNHQKLMLQRDSSTPPSFSLDTYTKVDKVSYFEKENEPDYKESNRYSLGSNSYFHEGYSTSDTWEENPSKYFVNSSNRIPYLELDPSDTILTNGDWYSDARSEFFAEDLSLEDGIVVEGRTDSRLYRRHANLGSNSMFVEEDIPEKYKDCIVLEIPIPSVASLTLSTDGDGDTERRQIGVNNFQTSQQSINTMAYYNFETSRWEYTTPSYSTDGTGDNSSPNKFNWVDNGDIGFGPLTGLVLPSVQDDIEYIVDLYGRPISDFGFPFAQKFASSEGQSIDMSKYIDEPVVLAGWEMYQKVVPVVGYQHDGNTEDGPDSYYGTSNSYSNDTLTGSRSKVSFSPGSAVPALDPVTVPNILFADYEYNNSLIDVYYSGELQKGGTLQNVTDGEADYYIDSDVSPNGTIRFRYALTTNAQLTVVARNLGGGTRTKDFFSPSGSITAGSNVSIPGVLLGENPDINLIDVYYNGELMRNGTSEQLVAGTADVSFAADSLTNGNLNFRFNVTSTDLICVVTNTTATADEAGEVTGTREKVTINISSTISTGTFLSIPNLLLAGYDYSNDKIDVYYNGEIQKLGTEADVTAGLSDYFIGTDVSPNGRIKFRYDLVSSDNIIVVARNMATTNPDGVGGLGTGRNPFYYGAHGHSTVMWNSSDLASPFTEEFYSDAGSGNWYHHNTVPIKEETLDLETKSIVTKGVTAFLLKESNFVDTELRKENFHVKERKVSLSTNVSQNSGANWNAPNAGNDNYSTVYSPVNTDVVNLDYENKSFFDTNNTRSLLGYLQHIYHNDTDPSGSRGANSWVRSNTFEGGNNELVGLVPRYRDQLNLVGILERENATYVPNILRANTEEYLFHVNGTMKIASHIDASFPITNFRINDVYEVTNINNPESNNEYHAQSVFGSNEGGVDNPLVNPETVPSVSGVAAKKEIKYPVLPVPSTKTGATGSELASWRSSKVVSLDGSKNQKESAETILRPSDKLILGIQDSVSTCFASQQNKTNLNTNSEDDSHFIRWGRNKLTIPEQYDSYIRLYIKKTRKDKTFNRLSTTSGYSDNVIRSLGDYDNADQHRMYDKLMYSGSISDDIVGPTYFSAPELEIRIERDDNINYSDPSMKNSVTMIADLVGGIIKADELYAAIAAGRNPMVLPWNSLNSLVFENDSEGRAGNFGTGTSGGETSIVKRPTAEIGSWSHHFNQPFDGPTTKSGTDTPILDALAGISIWTLCHPKALGVDRLGNLAYSSRTATGFAWERPRGTMLLQELCDNEGYTFPTYIETDEVHDGAANPVVYKKIIFADSIIDGNPVTLSGIRVGSYSTLTSTDRRIPNEYGSSSWSQKVKIPVFSKGNYFEPGVSSIKAEFRLVSIGRLASVPTWNNVTGYTSAEYVPTPTADLYPTYPDGTQMELGDAFYFAPDHTPVKLWSAEEIAANDSIPSNQRWYRNYQTSKPTLDSQIIYIVAKKGDIVKENIWIYDVIYGLENETVFTWEQVYEKIRDVLNNLASIEPSVLGTVSIDSEYALRLKFGDDPILRSVFQSLQEEINSGGEAYLGSQNLSLDPPVYDHDNDPATPNISRSFPLWTLENKIYIKSTQDSLYEKRGTSNVMYANTSGNTTITNTNYPLGSSVVINQIEDPTNNTIGTNYTNGSVNFSGTYTETFEGNTTIVDSIDDNSNSPSDSNYSMVKGYIPKWVWHSGLYSTYQDYLDNNVSSNDRPGLGIQNMDSTPPTNPIRDASGNLILNWMEVRTDDWNPADYEYSIGIDYSGLSSAPIELEIVEETYVENPVVSKLIDRRVARRTTEKTAGAFGSLNSFMTLVSDRVVHDSKYPEITDLKNESIDLHQEGYDTEWLMEQSTDKSEEIWATEIVIKMDTAGNPGYDTIHAIDGFNVVNAVLDSDESKVNEFTFATGSDSGTVWPTPMTNGYFKVTNYIQKEFGGSNENFSQKTVHDFLFGFGNWVGGRHTIRPSIWKYKAFSTLGSESLCIETIIDAPRGSRFGMYNTSPTRTTYQFSSRNFGQFRDMLEQPIDTKFSPVVSDSDIYGSPVVVTTRSLMNPDAGLTIADSKRYNKEKDASIKVPYSDENYESRNLGQVSLRSETLRVDTPGSIQTAKISGPGSLRANIFRRGQ